MHESGVGMSDSKGSTDESIGRPGEWREGRYEQKGKPVDQRVDDPAQDPTKAPDVVSTPVTRHDYEGTPPPKP